VHSREAFDSLREAVGGKLLTTTVRQSIAYAESAERAVSILDHRPDLGADYVALADELLSRLGQQGARRKLKALQAAGANGGPGATT
jgi:chromosome partitioning protein